MPIISNLNNTYNINNKKTSTKLTFETGEKFSARIIKTGDSKKDVVVRLLDGWQFPAELDEDLNINGNEVLKFQVEGFENGKLKIKHIKTEIAEQSQKENSLDSILEDRGFNKDDLAILEKMVKHNMPLTKDNISKIKSIVDLKDKIENSSVEEEAFIDRYIASKNIPEDSKEATKIRQTLKEFFKELKTLNKDDIFTLMENDIDLTKDNISSFNKLFKESLGLYKELEARNNLKTNNLTDNNEIEAVQEINITEELEVEDLQKAIKDIAKNILKVDIDVDSDSIKKLTDLLNRFNKDSIINSVSGDLGNKSNIEEMIKDILTSNIDGEKFEGIANIILKVQEEINSRKEDIRALAKGIFPKDLILTETEINNVYDELEKSTLTTQMTEFKDKVKMTANNVDNSLAIINMKSKDSLVNQLSSPEVLDILMNMTEDEGIMKDVLESAIYDKRYELKQDELKGLSKSMKNISSEDILKALKEFAVNSAEASSEKSGFIYMKDLKLSNNDLNKIFSNLLNADISFSDEEANNIINAMKVLHGEEKVVLKALNDLDKNLKLDSMGKQSFELVKEQMELKTENLKNIIKELLGDKATGKAEGYNEVLGFLKNNINDFKLFNSISNQYYYMDLPLNMNNKDYPCKIIIKDDRKHGKTIDSKDVKLVVSVKTGNLGMIDGFIKVKNQKMNIDMKCEKKWIRILEASKEKLIKPLNALGYDVMIDVTERKDEADITNCREFFNDTDIPALDIKV